MAQYRITVRYGSPRHKYHVMDVAADTLRDAMIAAAGQMPDPATMPDLVEIRLHQDPEAREFTPG
jgi:hypothetical protein